MTSSTKREMAVASAAPHMPICGSPKRPKMSIAFRITLSPRANTETLVAMETRSQLFIIDRYGCVNPMKK